MNFPEMFKMFFDAIREIADEVLDDLREIFLGGMRMIECMPGFNESKLLPGKAIYTFVDLEENGKFLQSKHG